jgi:Na+-transporting methylmalonyl-CoA/oxaloacetate decarboxylase gamma subunit
MALEGLSGGIIVAIVDFFMVFIVLGGLAGVIVLLQKFVAYWQENFEQAPAAAAPAVAPAPAEIAAATQDMKTTIAAILAALCEYTSLAPGSFKIDKIETLGSNVSVSSPTALNPAHVAAISIAIHEFLAAPMGSLQITGIRHLGSASSWKMAGRMEQMNGK